MSYLKFSAQFLGNPIKILGETVTKLKFETTLSSIKYLER